MCILRTIFKAIFFPPRLPVVTKLPEDCPSEGSVSFTCSAPMDAPLTGYIKCEFSSNWDENDFRLVVPCLEVMEQLCGTRQVLTKMMSKREYSEKTKQHPAPFTVRYREFLRHTKPALSTYAKDERTLEILTEGFDQNIFWAENADAADYCFFEFYVLPDFPIYVDAQTAAETVTAKKYDLKFDFAQYGPCALYITLNPKTTDVAALQEIVAAVCKEHNILFQNPPQS